MVLDLETIMEKTCADVLEYMHVYYVLEASSEKNNDHIYHEFFSGECWKGNGASSESWKHWTMKNHENPWNVKQTYIWQYMENTKTPWKNTKITKM